MYVHRWGHGPRLVLALHGWGGTHATFEPLLPWLAEDVTLIAPDLPGYGASRPPAVWTEEALTAPLLELLDTLPAPVTLLGNCSGAIIGMLTALRRPASFERLVLIDPFASTPWYFRIFVQPIVGRFFYEVTFRNPIGRLLGNSATAAHRHERTDMFASFAEIPASTALGTLGLLTAVGQASHFASLRLETDLLHGERTFAAIRRGLHTWRAQWPHARVHEIGGAGHLPIIEASASVASFVFGAATAHGGSVAG